MQLNSSTVGLSLFFLAPVPRKQKVWTGRETGFCAQCRTFMTEMIKALQRDYLWLLWPHCLFNIIITTVKGDLWQDIGKSIVGLLQCSEFWAETQIFLHRHRASFPSCVYTVKHMEVQTAARRLVSTLHCAAASTAHLQKTWLVPFL